MQNWNNVSELSRLHREDLLREAHDDRRAQGIDRTEHASMPHRSSVFLRRAWSPVLALLALIVGTHR
jgi:hypothetical protein